MVKVDRELLKGSTRILLLSVLARREMYGYQLVKELEDVSDGAFVLNEGTLYPLLHAMEVDGLVQARWVGEEGSRQRKYYQITAEGRAKLKAKRKEWDFFSNAVSMVLDAKGVTV